MSHSAISTRKNLIVVGEERAGGRGQGQGEGEKISRLAFVICTNVSDKRMQRYECLVGMEEMRYTEIRRGWTKEQESYFAET